MKRAIVSVINDLSTDQRVHKHCMTLHRSGYDVLLIGRSMRSSTVLGKREYTTHRMRLPVERGPLFYASFNVALFFNLLFRKVDLLFSNDLDTLLPNFLVSRIRNKNIVYDSHEYFTEVPELINRPSVQGFWKKLEGWILPKLQNMLTVNNSIAKLYKNQYGVEMEVLRNIPPLQTLDENRTRKDLGLPEDKRIILIQGSGINIHRGAEEAVEAMQYLDKAVLLIIGSGDVIETLHKMVQDLKLENKVLFKPKMPYGEMMTHTRLADLGLTLDKDTNINYRYSLPNKLFDYIHAGIPTMASDLIEIKEIIRKYDVGDICTSHDPKKIAAKMKEMLESEKQKDWRSNCITAKQELNWEKESEVLKQLIDNLNG